MAQPVHLDEKADFLDTTVEHHAKDTEPKCNEKETLHRHQRALQAPQVSEGLSTCERLANKAGELVRMSSPFWFPLDFGSQWIWSRPWIWIWSIVGKGYRL